MIKASEIEDEESLREWLEGQSVDAARVIAARAALRVCPITLSLHQQNLPLLSTQVKLNLICHTFQSCFLSWVIRVYPTHEIVNAIDVSFSSALSSVAKVAYAGNAKATNIVNTSIQATNSSLASVKASAYAGYRGDWANRVVPNIGYTAGAVVAAARADVVTAISEFANYTYITVQADAEWIENNPDDIDALINQPLWLEPNDAPESSHGLQQEIKEKFNEFRKSDLAQNTSFGLIGDWYAALLPEKGMPRSLFGAEKDLELATQPEEFWDGEAQEVMGRVADLVGWPEDYRKQEDEKTDKDEQAKSEKFSKAKAEKVSSNRMAVRLQLSAIVNSIAIEKEFIGEQPNEEEKQEDWLNKKKFLEDISELATNALDLLPIEPDGTQNEKDDEVASLLSEYAQEFEKWLRKNKPEVVDSVMRLGSAAGFTSVFYLVGGYMPLATPLIFGITCKEQALNILRILKSSVSKKKSDKKDG